MMLDDILKELIDARENILQGNVNCIPSPFTRFREEFPGIRKGFSYVVTGATKSSKTQITNFLFIINSIFYYINHPTQIKPTIHMFPLEETPAEINLRIYAYVINYLSKGQYHINPENLQSVDERKPLPQEVLDIMNSDEFRNIIKVFEDCIIFHEDKNPTGIYKAIKAYLNEHGHWEYTQKEITHRTESGEVITETMRVKDKYIPDDPKEYVIFIVDHVGLLSSELNNGKYLNLKESIEKLSSYTVELRNDYKCIPVLVQQQNSETTNLDAYKANKIRPTKDGLKDSKRTGEDCTVLLGITNPFAFELPQYYNYDISKLQDSFRVLEIVLARKGRANGLCPLFFDGAICNYKEMPTHNDTENMRKVYRYLDKIRNVTPENEATFFLFVDKFKQLINK